MYRLLRIHFGASAEFVLDFEILDNPVAQLWLERMEQRHQWSLDDPKRFYGFVPRDVEQQQAIESIQHCISIINSYQPIVERTITQVDDQDTLNYLHHIFEVYHGLLDQQNSQWWQQAPVAVQQALAQLNIAVHRCESCRYSRPRFVCTWFGMPKTKTLSAHLMNQYGQEEIEFGGVYLNYVEIGKTMMDLAIDNDQYIHDEAFKPFEHYSADFVAYFFDTTQQEITQRRELLEQYYQQHREFFLHLGIDSTNDYRARPLRFKVAQLTQQDKDKVIDQLKSHQLIAKIELI